MDQYNIIQEWVQHLYWSDDVNCATATVKVLAELFSVSLHSQVIDGAIGMHGAGKYGAQCGLVEGTLMFLGILGRQRNIPDELIVKNCHEYASRFERNFGSLSCSVLRPGGFNSDDPPHMCEGLTCKAIEFSANFVNEHFLNC